MAKNILILLSFQLCFLFVFSQEVKKSITKTDTLFIKNVFEPNEILIKYKTLLEQESKDHREYLESLYRTAIYFLGGLGAVFLGFFYYSTGKTRKEVKNQVDENFKEQVDTIIKEQTGIIEKNYRKKFNMYTDWMNRVILELSEKAISSKEDKPLSPINYEKIKGKSILWVDDKPENNEQHMEVFKSIGIDITKVKYSEEGENEIRKSKFDLIISNMGRPPKEGVSDNPKEGIEFIKKIKASGLTTPIIVYSKPETCEKFGDEANNSGAVAVTNGYTGLLKQVLKYLDK